MKSYLESRITHLKGITGITKLQGEASTRCFYRIAFPHSSLVAMVYPEDSTEALERIVRLTQLYKEYGLNVPEIREVIPPRILLQEDLGDLLLQKAFSRISAEEKERMLFRVARIIATLNRIPAECTSAVLDTARMKWEMDYFITHFVPGYGNPGTAMETLKENLHRLATDIGPVTHFAHRDFHSRNMLVYQNEIYLVDYQDSLQASVYYDLVSFAFDAYLDLRTRRTRLLQYLKESGMEVDMELFYLAALQRNIKALGTFGYQTSVRKKLNYKKYIPRTIRHISENPLKDQYIDMKLFSRYLPMEDNAG